MRIYKIAWGFWIVGSIIVALSWVNAVTSKAGWIGWGVALFGTVLSFLGKRSGPCDAVAPGPPPSTVVSDLDRLVLLRERGDITEEQYLRQRNALLSGPGRDRPTAP
jgi:hypothetical protein